MTTVEMHGTSLLVRPPNDEVSYRKALTLPEKRWHKSKQGWVCKPIFSNMNAIYGIWPDAKWNLDCWELFLTAKHEEELRQKTLDSKEEFDFTLLAKTPFKYEPMIHQMKALLLGRDMPYFAYLMDQGTGKTKVTIDDAAHNYREDRIEAMLVVAPNSVKTNWVMWECHKEEEGDMDALEDHMAPDIDVVKGVWISQPNRDEKAEWKAFEREITRLVNLPKGTKKPLVVLSVNIDALNVARCYDFLLQFVTAFRTMISVDESTRIKNRSSKRTKAAMKLRAKCPIARILSGTPIIKNPLNSFAQFGFLSADILGYGNFYSFRNRYATMGGFKDKQVMSYKNLDELSDKIASCSYRVLKKDCLDLPPQVYKKRRVTLKPAQLKAYKEMQVQLYTEWKDDRIEAPIVLTQLLLFQEIVGGYLPIIEGGERVGTYELVKPKENPKFSEVIDILAEAGDQQAVIWSRFIPEIDGLADYMAGLGMNVRKFYGGTKERDRISIRKAFARGEIDYIVANPAAGGIGIDEFKVAAVSIYLSNDFDTEKRVQSEDRQHRIGSEIHDAITYWDIIAPNTVDVKIIRTMRNDVEISTQVMRDGWKAWI